MAEIDLRLLLPRGIRRLPADLAVVVTLVLLSAAAVLVPVPGQGVLRIVLGLPLVLFLPGYAFIAALFPEAGSGPTDASADPDDVEGADGEDSASAPSGRDRGIDGIERVALSFGLSIAIVPLIGLVLNFTPWGIRERPILVSICGFTLLATAVAATRRRALPEQERFRVPYRDWLGAARVELFEPETRTDAALNVLLAVSVVLAAASVTYAVAVPKQGEAFTEFYLLTRDDGELVAADYPTELVQGEPAPLVIGIGNHEHREVEYTVVVSLQRVRLANTSATVLEERELDRLRTRLADNETWTTDYEVVPTMTGTRLRLVFLLYTGDPPADPSIESAYRETHLWVNVSAPS